MRCHEVEVEARVVVLPCEVEVEAMVVVLPSRRRRSTVLLAPGFHPCASWCVAILACYTYVM